jgi:Pyridoxamine 5'-phosphate oxidase
VTSYSMASAREDRHPCVMGATTSGPFKSGTIDRDGCLARFRGTGLARVLISVQCMPAAVPVFCTLSDGQVEFTSAEPSVIEAARRGDVLTVHLDGTDPDGSTWSVAVTGSSRVTDVAAAEDTGDDGEPYVREIAVIDVPLTVVKGDWVRWPHRP